MRSARIMKQRVSRAKRVRIAMAERVEEEVGIEGKRENDIGVGEGDIYCHKCPKRKTEI